jgi:hypothetical protein
MIGESTSIALGEEIQGVQRVQGIRIITKSDLRS